MRGAGGDAGHTTVAEYDDPTAMALPPEDSREKVERLRTAGRDDKAGVREASAATRREMAVVRLIAIDRAVRGTARAIPPMAGGAAIST